MNTTIHWLTTAFDGLVAFLPNLVAGLIILLVGWIIAAVLARATRAIAHRLGFERLVAKLGLEPRTTTPEARTASHWLGSVVYLIVMVVAVMQASRAWRLDFVAVGLAAVVAYLQYVVGAVFIFALALYAGNFVRNRFYRPAPVGEEAAVATTMTGPRFLPELLRDVIIAVGVFMALRELQIAPEIVNAAFILTLGAMAVAGALAFGLGGREVAGRIAQSWWDRRGLGTTITPPSGGPGRFEVSV